jgi:hypothetical protein
MCVQHPHFLNLAPTLGKVKSSIPHGPWRFNFFPNFFPYNSSTPGTSYPLLGFLFHEKKQSQKIPQELLV